jgi:hypothetical protein
MADPIAYLPAPLPPEGGGSRLEELRAALSSHGSDALAVVLARLDTPAGRATVTRLAKLLSLLGAPREELLEAVGRGLASADAVAADPTVPSWRDLARRARAPEVRRGVAVGIALLAGIGTVPRGRN